MADTVNIDFDDHRFLLLFPLFILIVGLLVITSDFAGGLFFVFSFILLGRLIFARVFILIRLFLLFWLFLVTLWSQGRFFVFAQNCQVYVASDPMFLA